MRGLALFATALLTLGGPGSTAGQAVPVGPDLDWREAVAAELGTQLSVEPSSLRAEVVDGLTPPVDSLAVTLAGSNRWIVTAWGNGAAQRRFLRVEHVATVPVAAHAIERGVEVRPDDVRFEERALPWSANAPSTDDPVGMVAARPVAAGEVLREPTVRAPLLVRGGEPVEAVLVRSGLLMTLRAEALGSARRGEFVHVRLPSGARAQATVVGSGLVHLSEGGTP